MLNKTNSNNLFIPFVISLVGVLALVLAFFLPYATAIDDYRDHLENYPDSMYLEEIEMTNEGALDISMLEYARIYAATADMGVAEAVSITCVVLIALVGLFTLLTALFSVLKKAIPLFIFNALAFGVFRLLTWDFEDRGVLLSYRYDYGVAYYLYYIGAFVVLMGAVYLFVVKVKRKKSIAHAESVE